METLNNIEKITLIISVSVVVLVNVSMITNSKKRNINQ